MQRRDRLGKQEMRVLLSYELASVTQAKLLSLGSRFLQFTVKYEEHLYSNPVGMLVNPEREALILEKSTEPSTGQSQVWGCGK